MVLLVMPILGFAQTGSLFKKDSLNLCLLKLDFLTYNFEGGNISHYNKCGHEDTLPFTIDFEYPLDFGGITFKTRTKLDVIFDATIVWAGRGKINYPTNFTFNSPFDTISKKVPKPKNLEYFNWDGSKIYDDTVFIKHADSAWDAISSLEITNKFSELDYKMGIYTYPPSVGLFNPWVAKWIIFLYQSDPDNTKINTISIENDLVYPNPFLDVITINITGKSNYKIFNSDGSLLRSGELNNNQIEVKELNSGVYYLSLVNENQTINKKIVKVNNR